MTVGFIGLGRMGRGMALNIAARAGVDLVVHDLDPGAVEALVAGGARSAAGIGDLVRESSVVFLSLPGPPQVDEVVLGEDGVLDNVVEGTAVFDLSTNSVSAVRALHDRLAAVGATLLDAPVSGGPAGAASGDLVSWIGGPREVVDEHRALLEAFSTPHHVGPVGAGAITKLTHNMTGYLILLALAETFSLGVKAGADPLELWKALRLGVIGRQSPLDMLVNQFLPGTYEPPAFALELAHKDVRLATDLAREMGLPMRLSTLTFEEMTEALARGFGHQDSRAYLKLQLERAGIRIAVDPEELRAVVAGPSLATAASCEGRPA